MATGWVHSFESLGTLDGPGLRFVVFLSGCPLRCRYCHNPDTWRQDSGAEFTAEEIVRRARRYLPYFKHGGGITLSGGEPLLQAEFAAEVLRGCRASGISTCVDTGGSMLNDGVKEALRHTDLVLLDVKHTDAARYRELTGGSLETNRAFLDYCGGAQIPLWVRQVIVPGWNDTPEDMRALSDYLGRIPVERVELLAYHTLGLHKWGALGLHCPLEGTAPPSEAQMSALRGELAARLSAQGSRAASFP